MNPTVQKLLWLALAGGLGALARYGLSSWVHRTVGVQFPWGTLTVNLVGCFAFGLVWTLAEERMAIPPNVRSICLIGFLGAFTTFSSYAFETSQLIRDSEWMRAGANLLMQNIGGLACLFLGIALGRTL